MRLRRLFGWSLAAVFLVGLGFVTGFFADRRYGHLLEGAGSGMMADASEAARFYWSKGSETYLKQGQDLYRAYCGLCHGAHGNDGRAPDLTLAAGTNAFELLRIIQRGIPGTEMPPFGSALNRRQAFQVVAHLKRLQPAPAARQISGVPDKGATLVRSKGNCLQCHIIGGEGVPVGPSLRLVGRSRSPEYLRRKLVTPEQEVIAAYRPIQVISQSGEILRGFRQNEDSFSIQVRDLEGGIHSFWKQDVEVRQMEGESLMPSYKDVFSEAEMQDAVAYLASLGRER